MSKKLMGLGRGLDSLISMDNIQTSGSSAINEIELSQISPNPEQPRAWFDEESLEELASSIRELGIIQPLTLRKLGAEMALIENIQREDLNAIEVALTFKKLIDQYRLTQEQLSTRIGKKRATIANFLRLLKLPAEVQLGLRDRRVDMGHARALLAVENPKLQLRLYNEILKKGLSVRQVEELAKEYNEVSATEAPKKAASGSSAREFESLKKHLSSAFQTKVQFSCDKQGKGKIAFPFKNEEELARLITIFDRVKGNLD